MKFDMRFYVVFVVESFIIYRIVVGFLIFMDFYMKCYVIGRKFMFIYIVYFFGIISIRYFGWVSCLF